MKKLLFLISFLTILGGANSVKAIVLGDEITSLSGITDGTKFIISDGTNAKYFYGTGSGSGENENKNTAIGEIPADAYYYFTLEKYTDGDIPNTTSPADNIYRIKITNAEGTGYPYGTGGGYYLNAVRTYNGVVISAVEDGWDGAKKDALWYVTYDGEKGFSFQNVYRVENSASSWLAIGNNFVGDQQYLKLYSKPVTLNFDAYGKATTSKDDLSATGGLSYNSETGVVTSDGTEGELKLEFAEPVDLRYLKFFNVVRSGSDDIVDNLQYYDEKGDKISQWNSIKWSNTWQSGGINDDATNAFLNHKPVKKLVWKAVANPENEGKTLTINSIEWTLKTISCAKAGETVLKSLPYQNMSDKATTPTWNVNTSTDTYYGTGEGTNAVSYTDITEYSELRIYRDNNTGFRAFFINAAGDKVNTINHENAASTWNGKYWSIDLREVEKYEGKVALQSIKSAAWGQNNIVNNIVVYKAPAANAPQYTLTGSGMQLAETVAALADQTATCIDATGVTGITTNSEAGRTLLTSANPNCLFLGTTGNGGLANTKNVISSGTCDNLELSDGNYPFKAPVAFTATEASYGRSFTVGQASTICLPFALTAEEAHTAGTFYTLTGYEGSTLTFTEIGAEEGTVAYKPYLFKAASATPFSTGYSSKAVAATPADLSVSVAEGAAVMTGTMAHQSVNGKYGWNSTNGVFSLATSDAVTIDPFRAYITVSGGGSSRMTAIFVEDSATGINEVSEAQNFQHVDGKVLENGRIVIFKNGMKYNAAGQQIK